jgi:hypothetical protein
MIELNTCEFGRLSTFFFMVVNLKKNQAECDALSWFVSMEFSVELRSYSQGSDDRRGDVAEI